MFKEDIARTIGRVLEADNHKMIYLDWGCIYFIKRYSDDLAFYIKCLDSRKRNRGVSIEMFFSPIEIPADNIMSLETKIHIHILTVYGDITDDIFVSAGKKVIAIERNVGNLSNMILEEFNEPFFQRGSLSHYKKELAIYRIVKEDTAIRQEFECLMQNVKKMMIKDKRARKMSQLCGDFIEQLPVDYFSSKGIDLELRYIKGFFANCVYAQCVLDV